MDPLTTFRPLPPEPTVSFSYFKSTKYITPFHPLFAYLKLHVTVLKSKGSSNKVATTVCDWALGYIYLPCTPDFQCTLGKKCLCKSSFQVGMDLEKVHKQGRDVRTQEDYLTSAKIHSRCSVVFLCSSISWTSFRSIPTWNEVLQKHVFN